MTQPLDKTWPVTIIEVRYGGVYEGGQWAAFHMEYDQVPADVMGSDPECMNWWHQWGEGVGVGESPEEALDKLRENPVPLAWVRDERLNQTVMARAPWGTWIINREHDDS